jgi:hypothetical protein
VVLAGRTALEQEPTVGSDHEHRECAVQPALLMGAEFARGSELAVPPVNEDDLVLEH